ncbi:hypothetical protein IM737_05455 [Devosia sp. SL43]|nr:hypothetical protein IM737_05455 [Devosia sp. SL43]
MNTLLPLDAAEVLIRKGTPLSIAGPEAALDKLSQGNWIGGTSPYFMLAEGGVISDGDFVFVTDLSGVGTVSFASYDVQDLPGLSANAPDNAFAVTIMPSGSQVLKRFAADGADFVDAFLKPAVGWVAGVHLNDIGKVTAKVYDGRTGTKYEDRAVVAYVALPADRVATIEIVNIFEPGSGDIITFDATVFDVETCKVNGESTNFAAYVKARGLEHCKQPLIGDYAGGRINVSLQSVDSSAGNVALYAPVFAGIEYRFARPVEDYAGLFRRRLAEQDTEGAVFACNCILNFIFGDLEGKAIGGVAGPITFGEIAYQLLNQTAVLVRVI